MNPAFQSPLFLGAADFFGPITGRFGAPEVPFYGVAGILQRNDDRFRYREKLVNRDGADLLFVGRTGGLSQSIFEYEIDSWNRVLTDELRSKLHGKTLTLWHKRAELVLQSKNASNEIDAPNPSATAQMRVDRLVDVQAELGFNTQDFAAVLGITRQQLYKWLNASAEVRLQEASRARLQTVERIAKEWKRLSEAPLSAVAFEELEHGVSAFSLLTYATIDEKRLCKEMERLHAMLATRPSTRSARLASAGVRRRPSAQSLRTDE